MFAVFSLAAASTGGAAWWWSNAECDLPMAARAIRTVDAPKARAVGESELAMNPRRRAGGLREVQPGWRIVPTKYIVCDGPVMQILLDERGNPVKVVSRFGDRGIGPIVEEFEVSDRALNGLSATWWGEPARLLQTAVYERNRRQGLTVEYGDDGQELARVEYRQDKPWTGRMLRRSGFAAPQWDVSYREGKLDGAEIFFETNGATNRLRTFRAGAQHGPERQYYLGVLRSESEYAVGKVVGHRSWHPNGQLEWLDPMDAQGRMHGCRQQWEDGGQLLVEENYNHGNFHGRRWEQGGQEVWFWNNKFLGAGNSAATEFQQRQRAAARGG
jgi:antitoxin component YwqK of YwqJK toxin-antitoxin module